MSKTRKSDTSFLLQGSILAIASIISRIVGLIYRLPLTAIIGKTGNDFYGTAYEIYNILLIISSYSIPLAVSKLVAGKMAKGESKNALRVLQGSLVFASISGGTAAVIVFFGADFFTGTLLKTPLSCIALKVLAPTLFVVAIVGVFRGFFQGLNTMMPSAFSQIAEQIINAIVSVVAAYMLFSYGEKVGAVLGDEDTYAAAYGAAGGTLGTAIGALTALAFLLFIYFVYRSVFIKKVKRDHTKTQESYGEIFKILIITIIPVLLSTTIYNISSIINQGIFKNIAVLQGYSNKQISEWWGVFTGQYKVIVNVPISIASAMAASCVPSLTTAYNSGNMKSVRRQINSATRFIMVIAFPCTVGIAVLGSPIMQLLFDDADPTSGWMLVVGSVAVLFYSLSTLSNGLLQGIDKLRIPVRNATIALIVQVLFLLVTLEVFHLHIFGVILTNAFYAFLMCLLNGLAVKKYSKARANIAKTYLIPAISSIVMGIVVYITYYGIYTLLHRNAIATLVAIIIGMIVYFVVLLLLKGLSENELKKFPKGYMLVKIAKKMHLM